MKGIIFTELVGFLEQHFDIVFADAVICAAELPGDGAFTTVGDYPSTHAIKLLTIAASQAQVGIDTLCSDYGAHLLDRFAVLFPTILSRYATADALLEHVGPHIHEEVRVIYPEARPPRITTESDGDDLVVTYSSHRPLAHIAHGLIKRSLEVYRDPRELTWVSSPTGDRATFRLARVQ